VHPHGACDLLSDKITARRDEDGADWIGNWLRLPIAHPLWSR
jgi:hypothetical protein